MWVSSAAPKSVSQRTASSSSIVFAPSGPSTAKPWFWLVISIRPGGQVLDRVVGAVVAERQLVGLEADRAAEQLVAEADAVHGQLADQLADRVDDVVERRRVAGAVGEEDRVGVVRRGARRRSRCTGAARPSRRAARRLRTIESLTPVSIIAIRGPSAARRALEHRPARRGVTSRARSRPAIDGSAAISSRASRLGERRREHAAAHRALVADVAHERARVEVGDRRDPAVGQPVEPARARRRARPRGRRAARMIAARAWIRSDSIASARDAVVADLRVGEGDQLAGVARVGHRLLVAGHRGREHDLADRVRVGAARERRRSASRPRAGRRRSRRSSALATRPRRASARGRRPRRRRASAAPGRGACGRGSSSSPSGSRSRARRPPSVASRSTRHRLAGSPGAIRGVGRPYSAAPAVIRSTIISSSSSPGRTSSV